MIICIEIKRGVSGFFFLPTVQLFCSNSIKLINFFSVTGRQVTSFFCDLLLKCIIILYYKITKLMFFSWCMPSKRIFFLCDLFLKHVIDCVNICGYLAKNKKSFFLFNLFCKYMIILLQISKTGAFLCTLLIKSGFTLKQQIFFTWLCQVFQVVH